jgi:hypothetical protein
MMRTSVAQCLFGVFGLVLLPQCAQLSGQKAKSAQQESSAVIEARDVVASTDNKPEAAAHFAVVVNEVFAEAEEADPPDAEYQRYALDLSKESLGYLDKALAKTSEPTATAVLNTRKGEMLLIQREFAPAETAIKIAIDICPSGLTVEPMLRALKLQSREGEMSKWCTDARANLCPEADLTRLCDACSRYDVEVCSSPEDQDLLADRDRQRIEAADAESRRGTDTDPNVLLDAVALITLDNLCPRSVRLFIGQEPVEGKGTQLTLDAQTKVTKSLQLHTKVWIVDAEGLTISSIIVKNENPTITINPSCNGFR